MLFQILLGTFNLCLHSLIIYLPWYIFAVAVAGGGASLTHQMTPMTLQQSPRPTPTIQAYPSTFSPGPSYVPGPLVRSYSSLNGSIGHSGGPGGRRAIPHSKELPVGGPRRSSLRQRTSKGGGEAQSGHWSLQRRETNAAAHLLKNTMTQTSPAPSPRAVRRGGGSHSSEGGHHHQHHHRQGSSCSHHHQHHADTNGDVQGSRRVRRTSQSSQGSSLSYSRPYRVS